MSSLGYLYVTEVIRDIFEKQLNKVFGKGKWYLHSGEYGDIEYVEKLPAVMYIQVMNEKEDWGIHLLGEIKVTNRFYIEYNDINGERCVGCEPIKIKILNKRKVGKCQKKRK